MCNSPLYIENYTFHDACVYIYIHIRLTHTHIYIYIHLYHRKRNTYMYIYNYMYIYLYNYTFIITCYIIFTSSATMTELLPNSFFRESGFHASSAIQSLQALRHHAHRDQWQHVADIRYPGSVAGSHGIQQR